MNDVTTETSIQGCTIVKVTFQQGLDVTHALTNLQPAIAELGAEFIISARHGNMACFRLPDATAQKFVRLAQHTGGPNSGLHAR